jgi:membrane protein
LFAGHLILATAEGWARGREKTEGGTPVDGFGRGANIVGQQPQLPDIYLDLKRREDRRFGQDLGKGLATDKPAISRRDWKDITLHIYRSIGDDRILANAAAVTFYALLALFPALTALVSIYGLFADPASIEQHLNLLSGFLPNGALNVINDELNRLASQPRGALSIGFIVGLIVSLWSANGGIKAMFDALNVVYGENEQRSFIRLNLVSLSFTMAVIVFVMIALLCLVAIPVVLDYLPGFIGQVLDYTRWPVMLVIVACALGCIYRYGPSRKEPHWVTWGSAGAALAWLGFSAIFSFYAANFGSFDKTYGSLGAVIGFMMWFWLSVIVILVGGKLNAALEPQTPSDALQGS